MDYHHIIDLTLSNAAVKESAFLRQSSKDIRDLVALNTKHIQIGGRCDRTMSSTKDLFRLLETMPNLTNVYIGFGNSRIRVEQVSDILSRLGSKVRKLTIDQQDGTNVSDFLSTLPNPSALEELNLYRFRLSKEEGTSSLRNCLCLKKLSMSSMEVADLSPLAFCKQLVYLDLSECRYVNLNTLPDQMDELTTLKVTGCGSGYPRQSDKSFSFRSLINLTLDNKDLIEKGWLTAFDGSPSIKKLDVSYAKSPGVLMSVPNLTNIVDLNMQHYSLNANLDGVQSFHQLRVINLSSYFYTPIDLTPLSSCVNLEEIYMDVYNIVKVDTCEVDDALVSILETCACLKKLRITYDGQSQQFKKLSLERLYSNPIIMSKIEQKIMMIT
jgi:hypothetical protein